MAAGKRVLTPTDAELRKVWLDNGGTFHGPNVETGTMPEFRLLPILRTYENAIRAQHEQHREIKRLRKQVDSLREGKRMAAIGRSMLG